MLWFGSAPAMEDRLLALLAEEPNLVARVVVHLGGLGRIGLTGAYTLAEMVRNAEGAGIEMKLVDVPDHATRVLIAVGVHGTEAEDD